MDKYKNYNGKAITHSFDINVAKKYSIEKAIILQDLAIFNQSKLDNNKLRYGLPLSYYSSAALAKKYFYMKSSSIARWLKDLEKDGILFSCISNKISYDRTKSYYVNIDKYNAISNGLNTANYNDNEFIEYCNRCISQNDKSNNQNDKSNNQNEQPIPNQTPNQTPNQFSESQNLKVSDIPNYVDLKKTESKKTEKMGWLGDCLAIIQEHLNIDSFDSYDNKKVSNYFYKIQKELTAKNKKNGVFSKAKDKSVIKCFKNAVLHLKNNHSIEKHNLLFLNTCINPNIYLNNQSNDLTDLEPYKQIVKSTFKHYKIFDNVEKNYLNQIIKAIKQYYQNKPKLNVLSEFKYLFDNLPQYIFKSVRTQSLSLISNKIDELLRQTDIRNSEKFEFYKLSFGEQRAYEILTGLKTA